MERTEAGEMKSEGWIGSQVAEATRAAAHILETGGTPLGKRIGRAIKLQAGKAITTILAIESESGEGGLHHDMIWDRDRIRAPLESVDLGMAKNRAV